MTAPIPTVGLLVETVIVDDSLEYVTSVALTIAPVIENADPDVVEAVTRLRVNEMLLTVALAGIQNT